jgi:hypothetical protein
MAKPGRNPEPGQPGHADIGTKERRDRGDIRITGEGKTDRRARAESSIERIASQKGPDGNPKLSAAHVEAARRYYACAAIYGAFGRFATMDLGKEVFGSAHSCGAEWQEDRKREYIEATRLISKRYSAPMIAVILHDATLTEAGQMMGGKGERAGQVAYPMLVETLDNLAAYFGLVNENKKPS